MMARLSSARQWSGHPSQGRPSSCCSDRLPLAVPWCCAMCRIRERRGPGWSISVRIDSVSRPSRPPPAVVAGPRDMVDAPMASWSRYYGTVPPGLESQLRLRQLAQFAGPRVMDWLWGLTVMIDPTTEMGRAVYLSGRYEPTTMYVMGRLLDPGGCFIDVGANAGYYTLAAAARVGRHGRVIAFEPSSREVGMLRTNVDLNALSNVTTVRAAVGDRAGRIELRIAEQVHSGHNTLGTAFAYESVHATGTETVPMVTLDDYLRTEGLRGVDVVKIDIEGAELLALRGATAMLAEMRPVVILELFDQSLRQLGASAKDVGAFLREASYTICNMDDATGLLSVAGPISDEVAANVIAVPDERRDAVMARVAATS